MARATIMSLIIATHAASVRAEVRVQGPASNVRAEARDATVAEVLAALTTRFGLRIRGTVGDRRVSGDFSGSLRRVIADVLEGYDYVIRTQGDGLEVIVMGTSSPNAVLPPVYAPPTAPTSKLRRNE